MSDPRRLLDDPSATSEERELLATLSAPTSLRDPTRSALEARVVRSLAVPAVVAKLLTAKTAGVVTAVLGGAAVLSFVFFGSKAPEHPPSPASRPGVAIAPPTVHAAPAVSASTDGAKPEPPDSEKAPTPNRLAPRPDTLALEETLLEQARRSLDTPARALTLLREHEKRFPNGKLVAERLYLSARAHARAGNQALARRYARRLAAEFPKSTYLEQVRPLLEGDSSTPER